MDDRRSEILRAASVLVDEGGVEAMTMRRLAERIGFTPPVIYEHFAGKEDVLRGVVDAALGDLAVVARQARSGSADPFMETARAVFRWSAEHRGIVEAMAIESNEEGPGAEALTTELAGTLGSLDPQMDTATMKTRAKVAWVTIQGFASQVERGAMTREVAEAMVNEAFAAYARAWSS